MTLADIKLAIIGLGYVELVQEMVAFDLADAKKMHCSNSMAITLM